MPCLNGPRHPPHELRVDPVVGVDDQQEFTVLERVVLKEPCNGSTLPTHTHRSFGHRNHLARDLNRSVSAAIGDDPGIKQLRRMILGSEIRGDPTNDRLLVMGGNNNTDPQRGTYVCSVALGPQAPERDNDRVQRWRDDDDLSQPDEYPYHVAHLSHRTSVTHMSRHPDHRPIAIVLGTRPEIIKLAKITELLGDDAHVVHTGQHYDPTLSSDFFTEFAMRQPDTHIGVGGQTRGAQIGNGTAALDELFGDLKPAAVVVQGDTNAVAAGSIAANAREIPLVHVEAGLRSFDRRMPEEHNRVLADHYSDLCLAPTEMNVANLAAEGITGDRVVLSGNPIVEAVERLMPQEEDQTALLKTFGVHADAFVLATLHRPENVDNPDTLRTVIDALVELDQPVLLPLHPRTRQSIAEFGLGERAASLTIVEPIGYRDFLGLANNARLIISDSGGVQEEVSVYKRPAVVVRRSTERQEVEGTFVSRIPPGPDLAAGFLQAWETAPEQRSKLLDIASPYGSTDAPRQCVDAIRALVERSSQS